MTFLCYKKNTSIMKSKQKKCLKGLGISNLRIKLNCDSVEICLIN